MVNEDVYIERNIYESRCRLFIVVGVDMNFDFKPHVRNEIDQIRWFNVLELPLRASNKQDLFNDGLACKFFAVRPFLKSIRSWIEKERKRIRKSKRIRNTKNQQPALLARTRNSSDETNSSDTENNGAITVSSGFKDDQIIISDNENINQQQPDNLVNIKLDDLMKLHCGINQANGQGQQTDFSATNSQPPVIGYNVYSAKEEEAELKPLTMEEIEKSLINMSLGLSASPRNSAMVSPTSLNQHDAFSNSDSNQADLYKLSLSQIADSILTDPHIDHHQKHHSTISTSATSPLLNSHKPLFPPVSLTQLENEFFKVGSNKKLEQDNAESRKSSLSSFSNKSINGEDSRNNSLLDIPNRLLNGVASTVPVAATNGQTTLNNLQESVTLKQNNSDSFASAYEQYLASVSRKQRMMQPEPLPEPKSNIPTMLANLPYTHLPFYFPFGGDHKASTFQQQTDSMSQQNGVSKKSNPVSVASPKQSLSPASFSMVQQQQRSNLNGSSPHSLNGFVSQTPKPTNGSNVQQNFHLQQLFSYSKEQIVNGMLVILFQMFL